MSLDGKRAAICPCSDLADFRRLCDAGQGPPGQRILLHNAVHTGLRKTARPSIALRVFFAMASMFFFFFLNRNVRNNSVL